MVDIRKRTHRGSTSYQVRYKSKASDSGYVYKTFDSLKAARHYVDNDIPKHSSSRHPAIRSVEQGVRKWLDVCQFEGRQGADAVSPATLVGYQWRADIILAYEWTRDLHELDGSDVAAFRSWLLRNYSRETAKKVLSSFHSMLLEMLAQGVLTVDPAAGITIQESRYAEPVRIPSIAEMRTILAAADDLAGHHSLSISKAWERYQAMVYLAADSGLRPQELLALPLANISEKGVRVTQALDRDGRIGPPKTRAGRRFIPVGEQAVDLARFYACGRNRTNLLGLLFPDQTGGCQSYANYLNRCWYRLMEQAGMVVDTEAEDGTARRQMRFTPYSLRHFYASMLIAQRKDLKTLQTRMGHEDATMTLNVYGHLIRQHEEEDEVEDGGVLVGLRVPSEPS